MDPQLEKIKGNEKIAKRFDSGFKKLLELLSLEEKDLSLPKVPSNRVTAIINEMFQEEIEQAKKEFKTKAKSVIVAWNNYKKERTKAFKAFVEADDKQKEAFANELDALFALVGRAESITTDTLSSISEEVNSRGDVSSSEEVKDGQ